MAATVDVKEVNGASVETTVTAIRFCTTDMYNPLLTYPIPIPAAGYNYSYWKHILLALSGTFTKINNVRFYSDGAIGWTLGTSGKLNAGKRDSGDNGCPIATSYEQATGTEGTSGYAMDDATNGHDYYKSQTTPTVDVATLTSVAPLTVDTADHTTSESTKAVVLQVKVDTDATAGDQADETLTFMYDEI